MNSRIVLVAAGFTFLCWGISLSTAPQNAYVQSRPSVSVRPSNLPTNPVPSNVKQMPKPKSSFTISEWALVLSCWPTGSSRKRNCANRDRPRCHRFLRCCCHSQCFKQACAVGQACPRPYLSAFQRRFYSLPRNQFHCQQFKHLQLQVLRWKRQFCSLQQNFF